MNVPSSDVTRGTGPDARGTRRGRSDGICPGEEWCYVYDTTEETIGAWPFHDHHMDIAENTNRGLFGGIVVRDPNWCEADYEVPLFLHRMEGKRAEALFDSGTGIATTHRSSTRSRPRARTSTTAAFIRCAERCESRRAVRQRDGFDPRRSAAGPRFEPLEVTIAPGAAVTWTHAGDQPHTVTDAGGAGLESRGVNGRVFVGNTPTIVDVTTTGAADIDSVVLLRPCAMTHHTDAGQRYIKLAVPSRDPTQLTVQAPADGNVAPPGYYMLFILNAGAVPFEARFVRVS